VGLAIAAKVTNLGFKRLAAYLQLVLESLGELPRELSVHVRSLGRNSNLQQLDCCFSSVLLFSLVSLFSKLQMRSRTIVDEASSAVGCVAQAVSLGNLTLESQRNKIIQLLVIFKCARQEREFPDGVVSTILYE
jgi:hypothetical protein